MSGTDVVAKSKNLSNLSQELGKSPVIFSFMVVVEYISDPRDLTPDLRASIVKTGLLDSPDALNDIPGGTIIGLPITKNAPESDKVRIVYPFHSHASVPVKKDEHIWCITDEFGQSYWMGRKVSIGSLEDLNKNYELRKRKKPEPANILQT